MKRGNNKILITLSLISIFIIGDFALAQQVSARCITACLTLNISEADRLACRHHCPQNPQMQDPTDSTINNAPIKNCRKLEGSITTIEDDLCKMNITGCTQDGQLLYPQNSSVKAVCDSVIKKNRNCRPPCPPGQVCSTVFIPCRECPTNPNECANDDENDGIGQYTSTEVIQQWDSPNTITNYTKEKVNNYYNIRESGER